MSDDLVTFLRARLDEDQQAARAAANSGHPQWKLRAHEADNWMITDGTGDVVVYDEGDPSDAEAAHIARHDPARVLREVEAKRRIIDLHGHRPEQAWDGSALVGECAECIDEHYPCATLRLLALPYDQHPDYRAEEWKP